MCSECKAAERWRRSKEWCGVVWDCALFKSVELLPYEQSSAYEPHKDMMTSYMYTNVHYMLRGDYYTVASWYSLLPLGCR